MPSLVPAHAVPRWTAVLAALALGLTGCSDDPGTAAGQAAGRTPGQADSLRPDCPETVVVQTNWWPQAEYGGLYRLLGEGSRVDKDRKAVSGPLVAGGADTGVRIEIRSGGPPNNFTPAAKILYLDRSVTLGGADLDQAAQFSKDQPVLGVFAPMELSPLVLMWDPVAHPDFHSIADVGQTDTRVLYYQGATYMDYLVGTGVLRQSQVEASYDGTPARFVAEGGRVVQQGYLTNEVFQYERELPQWRRPVAWQLVSESGFPTYPEVLAIRADRRDELAPCLRKLVPALQRSTADYAADPTATNELIAKLVEDFGAFAYGTPRARYAVDTMKANGILGNGGNATVGDFDADRVRRLVNIVRPIFAAQRKPIREGLRPEELFTNEFIDPSIGLRP